MTRLLERADAFVHVMHIVLVTSNPNVTLSLEIAFLVKKIRIVSILAQAEMQWYASHNHVPHVQSIVQHAMDPVVQNALKAMP